MIFFGATLEAHYLLFWYKCSRCGKKFKTGTRPSKMQLHKSRCNGKRCNTCRGIWVYERGKLFHSVWLSLGRFTRSVIYNTSSWFLTCNVYTIAVCTILSMNCLKFDNWSVSPKGFPIYVYSRNIITNAYTLCFLSGRLTSVFPVS